MTINDAGLTRIELSRAEQWVVHHLMLDSIGLAAADSTPEEPPKYVIRILQNLETGANEFTPLELDHIRYACSSYTRGNDIPEAERKVAASVIRQIDAALGDDGLHTTTTA